MNTANIQRRIYFIYSSQRLVIQVALVTKWGPHSGWWPHPHSRGRTHAHWWRTHSHWSHPHWWSHAHGRSHAWRWHHTWRWHAHGRASHPHGWRYHGSTGKLSSFEGRGCGVNQVLGLVLHPFLIVELHILLVLPS